MVNMIKLELADMKNYLSLPFCVIYATSWLLLNKNLYVLEKFFADVKNKFNKI